MEKPLKETLFPSLRESRVDNQRPRVYIIDMLPTEPETVLVPKRVPKWHLHRRLYDWVLHWADSRYGTPAMAALGFSEAIFFPVPADVLLLALCMGKPKRSFFYSFICTAFSIIGGSVAFLLGSAIGRERLLPIFETVHLDHKAQLALDIYQSYGFWAIAIAALTPVPYMLFSWLGGFSGVSLGLFVLTSMVFRSMRFFSEGLIIYLVGPKAKKWIDKYFNLATILIIVLLAGVFLMVKGMSHLFVPTSQGGY